MEGVGASRVTRRILPAAWVTLALAWPVRAGEPPKPPFVPQLTDSARRGLFRARIVSGRITMAGSRLFDEASEIDDRRERLTIRVAGRQFALHYELSSPAEEVALEVNAGRQLHVRRTPKGDSPTVPVEYRQPVDGPVELWLGPQESRRVCQAANLWQLFISEPEACREHLAPLLDVLGQRWDVNKTAEQVETALLLLAAEGETPKPKRWAALVKQLGDPRFSRREAADRELRALGPTVLSYLKRLDRNSLDAEQHYRIRRIVVGLSSEVRSDTPTEIARWLAGDPMTWLGLLSREEPSARELAAGQLEALLDGPVDYDPAADEPTRAEQVKRLRLRILGPDRRS
ncbi:MAG: hypothetical protein ACYTG0_06615 [Planctomycetota bacterium]|jgi:hypothetical protein